MAEFYANKGQTRRSPLRFNMFEKFGFMMVFLICKLNGYK